MLIVASTDHDDTTSVLHGYAAELFRRAQALGPAIHLTGATRSPLLGLLAQHPDAVFAFYGHGEPSGDLLGADGAPLVTSADASFLAQRITCAASCFGDRLAPHVRAAGGTFVGHTGYFWVPEPPDASAMTDSALAVPTAIISGASATVAVAVGKQRYRSLAMAMRARKHPHHMFMSMNCSSMATW